MEVRALEVALAAVGCACVSCALAGCGARTGIEFESAALTDVASADAPDDAAPSTCVLGEPREVARGPLTNTTTLGDTAYDEQRVYVTSNDVDRPPRLDVIDWDGANVASGLAPVPPRRTWRASPAIAIDGDRLALAALSSGMTVDVLTLSTDRIPDGGWLTVAGPSPAFVGGVFGGGSWWVLIHSLARTQINRFPRALAQGMSWETSGDWCGNGGVVRMLADASGRGLVVVCNVPQGSTWRVRARRVDFASGEIGPMHEPSAAGQSAVLLAAAANDREVLLAHAPSSSASTFATSRLDVQSLARRATPTSVDLPPSAGLQLGASLAANGADWFFTRIRAARASGPPVVQVDRLDEDGQPRGERGEIALAGFDIAFSPRVLARGDRGVVLFNGRRDRGVPVRVFAVPFRCARSR